MNAEQARKNVDESHRKLKQENQEKERELQKAKTRARETGATVAETKKGEIEREIAEASKNGRTEYTYYDTIYDKTVGGDYVQGYKEVIVPWLESLGFTVCNKSRRVEKTKWHGSMSDVYPTYHFDHYRIEFEISWS